MITYKLQKTKTLVNNREKGKVLTTVTVFLSILVLNMYITNFQHFLDEQGEISTRMPKKARKLANLHALLVNDASTAEYNAEPIMRHIKIRKFIESLLIFKLIFRAFI